MNNEVNSESEKHLKYYQNTDHTISADIDSQEIQKKSDSNLSNFNIKSKKQRSTINRKKNYIVITKNTIVYDIPGIGDKFKNYEKITKEIKPCELEIIKENKKKLQNQYEDENIYDEDEIKRTKTNKIFITEPYNIFDVIKKFAKEPEKRTIEDLYIIKNYLFQTEYGMDFVEGFNKDHKIVESLITFCGLEFRYKKFLKGETLFRIGEPPDNFYLILFGKVDILKPLPKKVFMTGFQYFNYLMDLKKNNEIYRFNLCIKKNLINFIIEPEHSDIIQYIYLMLELNDIHFDEEFDLEPILKLINIEPEKLDLDPKELANLDYLQIKIKKIKKKITTYK